MFVVKKSEASTDDPSRVTIEIESVPKNSETVNQGSAENLVQVSESIASIEVPENDSGREVVIRGEDGSVSIVTEIRTEEHEDQVDQVKPDSGTQPANSNIELSEELIMRIVESATCVTTDSGTEYQTVSYTNATSQDCSYLDSSTGIVLIQEFVSEDAVDTEQADGHSELHDAVANISEHVKSDKVRDILVVNDVCTLQDDQPNSGETFQVYSSLPVPAKGSERFEIETCSSDMDGAFKNYPVYPFELSTKPKSVRLKESEKKKSTVLPPSNYSLVKKFSPEDLIAMGKTEDDIMYGYSERSRKRRINALAKERSKVMANVPDEGDTRNAKPNEIMLDVDSSRENLNVQNEDVNVSVENENFGFEYVDNQESCSTSDMNKDMQTVKPNTNDNKRKVADRIKEADKEYSPKKIKIIKEYFMTESSPNVDYTKTVIRMGDDEAISDFTNQSLPTNLSGETEADIPIKVEDESEVDDCMEMNYWSNICKCFHYPDRCVIKIAPILRKMVKNRECVIEVDIEDTLSVGPFQKDQSVGGLSKYCVSITKPTETTYGTQNVNKAGSVEKPKLKTRITRIRKKKYRKKVNKSSKELPGLNVSETVNPITDSGINTKTMEEDLSLNVTTNPSDSPDEIENDIDVADDDNTTETSENTNNELPTEGLPNAPVIFTSGIVVTESDPVKTKTNKRKRNVSKKRSTGILKAKTFTQKTPQPQADVLKQNVSEGIDVKDFEVPPVVLLEKLPGSPFQNESGLRQRSKRQIKKVKRMSPDDFDKKLNPPKKAMEKDKTTGTRSPKKEKNSNMSLKKVRGKNASPKEVNQINASISEVQESNATQNEVKESDGSQNDVKESIGSPTDMQKIGESPKEIEESNGSPKDMEESKGSLKDMKEESKGSLNDIKEGNGSPKNSKQKPKRKKKKKGESKPRAEKKYTVTINAEGTRLFGCTMCDFTIISRTGNAIRDHINLHTGEKRYECEVCHNVLRSQRGLNSHRKKHLPDYFSQCQLCQKQFKDSSSFKRHVKRHLGRRDHVCEMCGKTYENKFKLKIHLRVHNGERLYECDLCGKMFFDVGTKKRHRDQHVRVHRFECGKCRNSFVRLDACKAHIKAKHPDDVDSVEISKVITKEHIGGSKKTRTCGTNTSIPSMDKKIIPKRKSVTSKCNTDSAITTLNPPQQSNVNGVTNVPTKKSNWQA